jgi:hypothetical protein
MEWGLSLLESAEPVTRPSIIGVVCLAGGDQATGVFGRRFGRDGIGDRVCFQDVTDEAANFTTNPDRPLNERQRSIDEVHSQVVGRSRIGS